MSISGMTGTGGHLPDVVPLRRRRNGSGYEGAG